MSGFRIDARVVVAVVRSAVSDGQLAGGADRHRCQIGQRLRTRQVTVGMIAELDQCGALLPAQIGQRRPVPGNLRLLLLHDLLPAEYRLSEQRHAMC